MTPVRTATAMNVDTNPMVQPSLSMKNLQQIISTVTGSPWPGRRPGAAGSHSCQIAGDCLPVIFSFTLVKTHPGNAICRLDTGENKFISSNRPAVWPVSDRVNTSGRYRDNALPAPEGNACPASYPRSVPGRASMERRPALRPTWRWSASPAALSCKARPEVSSLLY